MNVGVFSEVTEFSFFLSLLGGDVNTDSKQKSVIGRFGHIAKVEGKKDQG